MPDDCDELQTLRIFRDKRKATDPEFAKLVEEYYRIAPIIVERINGTPESKVVYQRIYDELVMPCVKLIKANEEESAIKLYTEQVRMLERSYVKNDG